MSEATANTRRPLPLLTDVVDLRDERRMLIPVTQLMGDDYGDGHKLRMLINETNQKEGGRLFACPSCMKGLFLKANPGTRDSRVVDKRFHFAHYSDEGCYLAEDRGLSSEKILAAKFMGRQEGPKHRFLKELIHECLMLDPDFTDVQMEQTWRGQGDPTKWRRPDVSAVYRGRPIVFEIQLATTFGPVMAARRVFYRDQGAQLVWVVDDFTPEWAPLTQEEIFFNNNSNIFVASELTRAESRKRGALVLEAHWHEPYDKDGVEIGRRHRKELVNFRDLEQRPEMLQVFRYDVDAEVERLKSAMGARAQLRRAFEKFWTGDRSAAEWATIRRKLIAAGVQIPASIHGLGPLLQTMYYVRTGGPSEDTWRHKTLLEVAHHLYAKHPKLLRYFGWAVQSYGRASQLQEGEAGRKWMPKAAEVRSRMQARDPKYMHDPAWIPLMCLLFPEVAQRIRGTQPIRQQGQ